MSSKRNYHSDYSHIYVEHSVREHPNTESVLSRFKKAQVIEIRHYKDVFNRSGQHWREQKKSQKLILARRESNFLYDGSRFAPDYGFDRFFYNALTLNCVYDCSYCYLQGMYSSANAVLFMNEEDYFEATRQELKNGPMYLCISYDTDLLAFEHILPYSKHWIQFTRNHPDLTIELRTKSVNYRAIADEKPSDNIVLAWTLSPAEIAKKYEAKTPPLTSRIRAIKQAIEDGWRVRVCFDPLLHVDGWQNMYRGMVQEFAKSVTIDKLEDISIGTFRMNKEYLRNIRKQRSDADIIHYPYHQKNGMVSYSDSVQEELTQFMVEELKHIISPEKISVI